MFDSNNPNQAPRTANAPSSADYNSGWLDDMPPGGDLPFDEMFPNPEVTPAPQPPAPPVQDPEPYIRTATGTVYKTMEDAIRGTEEKDRVIERLRSEIQQTKGYDPLKKSAPAAQPAPEATPNDPASLKRQYFKRLADAATSGNEEAYIDTLVELQQQVLAPFAPVITEVSRERAVKSVEGRAKGVREFLASQEYAQTLEQFPALGNAIRALEQSGDPEGTMLPQLYELAWRSHLSTVRPANAPSAPQTTRPAVSTPTTPTPPSAIDPLAGRTREQLLRTPEGRKAIIEQFERSSRMDERH